MFAVPYVYSTATGRQKYRTRKFELYSWSRDGHMKPVTMDGSPSPRTDATKSAHGNGGTSRRTVYIGGIPYEQERCLVEGWCKRSNTHDLHYHYVEERPPYIPGRGNRWLNAYVLTWCSCSKISEEHYVMIER